MRTKILLLLVFLVPGAALAQPQSATQLDVRSLLREVETKQKQDAARARPYSFTLKRTIQELNNKGEVKKEKLYLYQVFPVRHGLPAMLLLSEAGKPLSDEKLTREKVKTNKYWQEHKNDLPNSKDGEETPWFAALDYTFVGNQPFEGREVVVLSFTPKTDYAPKKDNQKFVSGLKGEVWIDPAEKVIVKIHGELTNAVRSGGLSGWLSSLRPGSLLTVEFMSIGDGLWAAKRVDFAYVVKYSGSLFLQQTAHSRQFDEMSDYHLFDPETKDLFAKP